MQEELGNGDGSGRKPSKKTVRVSHKIGLMGLGKLRIQRKPLGFMTLDRPNLGGYR